MPSTGVALTPASQARKPIRVLSVDDHPLLRDGITAIVSAEEDMCLAGMAAGAHEAIQRFREHRPDVTLMDLRLPDLSGIDALIAIRTEFPEARIIMLTTFNGDVDVQRALKAGAYGYLRKSAPRRELVEAIRHVHSGKKSVPPKIAAQIAQHLTGDHARRVPAAQIKLSGSVLESRGGKLLDSRRCPPSLASFGRVPPPADLPSRCRQGQRDRNLGRRAWILRKAADGPY